MLVMLGSVLLGLGVLSGAALVAAGLGLAALTPGMTLWITFPLLSLLGFGLFVMDASLDRIRAVSVAASSVLLLLALGSLVALLLQSAGLVQGVPQPAGLWYVVIVGGVLGLAGAAGRRLQQPTPS